MVTAIKKEASESHIPFLKTEETSDYDFSFNSNDEKQQPLKQEQGPDSYDNLFKNENNSVDLFLKEINNTQQELPRQDDIDFKKHISPTKPLNLKNASKTNINELLETDNESDEVMQDIPMVPKPESSKESQSQFPLMRNNSQLKGPRAVHETPVKSSILKSDNLQTPDISPSRKTVFIDLSPPKVVEYQPDEITDEEEEEQEAPENFVKPNWKPLNTKKIKPLPQPISADSSLQISPKQKQYIEEDDSMTKDVDLTTEEIASIKKMTLEDKLNAVLDSKTNNIDFDHDKYLEDAKFKRTKSVVKRNSYYDDMLLNSLKNKDSSTVENYDGLTDLYDSNFRNTQSSKSLKLDLNRSNSIQSQFSILSGERILETTSPSKIKTPNSADGVKGFDDDSIDDLTTNHIEKEEELMIPIEEELENEKAEHLEELTEISSKLNLFDKTQEEDEIFSPETVEKRSDPAEQDSADVSSIKLSPQKQRLQTPQQSPVKVSHSRQSSITELLSPYKMGLFLVNVGSNLKKIVSSQDLASDLKTTEESKEINVFGTTAEDEFTNSTADEFESANSEELIEDLPKKEDDEVMMGNSTELVDEASTTLENSDSPSIIEISKGEYQLEASPEFDDDPHSFSLELEPDVVVEQPRKIMSSNVSSSSSPQLDVLSIWQSQPEYKHVPKHKTTRCSSVTSSIANNSKRASLQYKIEGKSKNQVHVLSKRVVSQEYEDSEIDMLPNISGDSDFGSSFKKLGLKIDEKDVESDDEIYHDSQEILSSDLIENEKKNVQNIWRSGTIRSHKDKPQMRLINVYSDEEHEVKNVRSTVQVNEPFKTHKQHEASVEIETMFPNEDMDSINTSIRTSDEKEVTVLANLSEMDNTPLRPLGVMSQSRINSLPQQQQALVEKKLVNGERGRFFIRLNRLAELELPDYRSRKLKFCVVLDNGIHRIQTDYFKLDDRVPMDKEFEMIVQDSTSCILTLKAKYDKPSDTLVEVQEREVVKSKSFFGKLFGNKHVITRTKFVNKPAPFDSWDQIMAKDGSFGKVLIDLSNYENPITGRAINYQLPLLNEWNSKNYHQLYKIGILDLQMLFLPRVSKFEILPTSIKQLYEELAMLNEQKSIKYEGYLFQEGGDCKFMKRRFFKLQDSTLIAHNEDTLKTRCKINLTKVVELIYLTNEIKSDRNFSDNLLTNSFKLKFANNEIIEFNAQDKFEKIEWLQVLQDVINKNHFARQPWVKLMHEKNTTTGFV